MKPILCVKIFWAFKGVKHTFITREFYLCFVYIRLSHISKENIFFSKKTVRHFYERFFLFLAGCICMSGHLAIKFFYSISTVSSGLLPNIGHFRKNVSIRSTVDFLSNFGFNSVIGGIHSVTFGRIQLWPAFLSHCLNFGFEVLYPVSPVRPRFHPRKRKRHFLEDISQKKHHEKKWAGGKGREESVNPTIEYGEKVGNPGELWRFEVPVQASSPD